MPFAVSNGVRLYYDDDGDPHAPAMIFAHGGEGTRLHWWQQVAHFKARYRCISYDARGFGQSDSSAPAPEQGLASHSEDLVGLLDVLGIAEAVVVGHSMGGFAASYTALNHPRRVRGLVMSDTAFGFFTPALAEWAAAMIPKVQAGFDVIAACTPSYFADESPGLAHLFAALSRLNPPRTGPRGVGAYEFIRDAPRGDYRKFARPALFIVGADDALTFPWLIRATAEAVANARFVEIAHCGHSAYFERAAAFNATIDAFLADLPPPPDHCP